MYNMDTSGYCYLGFLYPLSLLFPSSSIASVELQQTIPENNSLVCPGEELQYTCITDEDSLGWQIPGQAPTIFSIPDDVNTTRIIGSFELTLADLNESSYISTATNIKVTPDLDNAKIGCGGGSVPTVESIAVADGPANCSNVAVTCKATPDSLNNSETHILVSLSTNSSLMCVVAFKIQFNGQNLTALASSPSATFTISKAEGHPFLDERIYTLDHENRTGQVTCVFSVPEPSGVEKITIKPECDTTTQNLSVTFSWKQSMIGGCLDEDNVTLEYVLEYSSSSSDNSHFNNISTSNTSYLLPGIPQGTDLEITIIPILPDLGLRGSPLSTAERVVNTSCLAGSSRTTYPTTSPTTSPETLLTSSSAISPTVSPTGGSVKVWLIMVPVSIVILLIIVSFLTSIGIWFCCRHRRKAYEEQDLHVPNGTLELEENCTLNAEACGHQEQLQLVHLERKGSEPKINAEETREGVLQQVIQENLEKNKVLEHRLTQEQEAREKVRSMLFGELAQEREARERESSKLFNELAQEREAREKERTQEREARERESSKLFKELAQEREAREKERKREQEAWEMERRRLEEMLVQAQEEKEKLVNEAEEKDKKIKDLQSQMEKLVEEKDEKIKDLQFQMGQLLEKLDKEKEEKEKLADKVEEKNKEIKDLQCQMEKLEGKVEEKDKEIKGLQSQMGVLQEEKQKTQERVKNLEEAVLTEIQKRDIEKQKSETEMQKLKDAMLAESQKRDIEKQKSETEMQKLKENQQLMQQSFEEYKAQHQFRDKDNPDDGDGGPIHVGQAQEVQHERLKLHSDHVSDSGLPETSRQEGDTDTEGDYVDDEPMEQTEEHILRPEGQQGGYEVGSHTAQSHSKRGQPMMPATACDSRSLAKGEVKLRSHLEQSSGSSQGQLVSGHNAELSSTSPSGELVSGQSARPISAHTYTSEGSEIVAGQTTSSTPVSDMTTEETTSHKSSEQETKDS